MMKLRRLVFSFRFSVRSSGSTTAVLVCQMLRRENGIVPPVPLNSRREGLGDELNERGLSHPNNINRSRIVDITLQYITVQHYIT